MKNFNKDRFLDDVELLSSKINNFLLSNEDADIKEIVNNFVNDFSKIVNQHAPLRPQSRKERKLNSKPWINHKILKLIRTKNSMFRKCYKKNDSHLIEKYKKMCYELTTIKRNTKQHYFATMINENKNNLQKQWQLINQILQRNNKQKKAIHKLVTGNDETLTDCQDICNELNNYFINIGPKMVSKIPSNFLNDNDPSHSLPSMTTSMFCEPCFQCEVYQNIICLNEKKSVGIENIPIKFIKISAEYISLPLAIIFNKCMQVGIFPKLLKIAKITPLHKNGSIHRATNYRPISVLSPFSKIFGKILFDRLNKYFFSNSIISKEQLGFRVVHSTTHVITDIISKLRTHRDNKNFTCLILLE